MKSTRRAFLGTAYDCTRRRVSNARALQSGSSPIRCDKAWDAMCFLDSKRV